MKIKLKANKQGQIYLPKILREQWGNEYILIPNAEGGYMYPVRAGVKGALRSLEVVEKDLRHRVDIEARRGAQQPETGSQTAPEGEKPFSGRVKIDRSIDRL